MAWTIEQQEAIDKENTSIIVSAGAGSGKTAVLTARVQRKLLSGVHVNELLVLTFTNAAAAEMKERIRKTIKKTKGLESEADLVDGAYITTFDSFSLSMVKKYHTRLNVTNNIGITDEVVIDIKKHKILDEIFDENYLSPKGNFMKLINNFCLKDDKKLKEAILKIYKKIELKDDKDKYLENYFETTFNDDYYETIINQFMDILNSKKDTLNEYITRLNDYFDGDFVIKVEDNFKKILNATSYEEYKEGCNYKSITVPRGSDEAAKKIKKNVFDIANSIKELCIYNNQEEILEEISYTKEEVSIIIDILKELDKRLEEYKKEEGIYNFTDIARLAIKVVRENEDIREELKYSFNEIMVDEYQDTSDTQELFISLISNNNVYMVGDIKQSIYRFRNANPYIFKNKYDTFRDTDMGYKIDLLKNFRSRGEVLDNVNTLFDLFMDDKIGGADYKVSHRMVFGNTTYIEEGKTNQNYQMDIYTYDKEKIGKLTTSEEEAFIIGNDIIDKVNNHFQVFDKDKKILRDITYSDFVILLDKSRDFDLYKKIFEYLGIPLYILKDESLAKADDIYVIKNIFRLLLCIKEDRFDLEFRYCFTSISRSFLLKIDDEEIYNYFLNNNFKESELYKICLELTKELDTINLSSLFLKILEVFNYEEKLITVGNIKSFRVREEYLYNLCCNYEVLGKTINDFVEYLTDIFDSSYDIKFNINESSSNSCRIMTIHKSKGLEFPICYFAGFTSRFNLSELKEKIIYDNMYGIILPKVDESYKDTVLKTLLKDRTRKEEISEKIRLLYVAVTRAKEKMIFVLPKQEEESEVIDLVDDSIREKYNSFLSIMKSIYSSLLPYITEKEIVGNKDYLQIIKEENSNLILDSDNLEVNEVKIDNKVVVEKHFSKDKLHIITEEEKHLLDFGTKVHEILEEIDFNNYNLDNYNISDNIKNKINSFINSSFMKDKLNYKMYKEYEFIYHEDGTISTGVIDLLIERDNDYVIIDYKLKDIMDNEYNKQLNGYRKYIMEKTKKSVVCYLYSILNEEYREVLND